MWYLIKNEPLCTQSPSRVGVEEGDDHRHVRAADAAGHMETQRSATQHTYKGGERGGGE